jgi:hypothetical protein
MNRLPQTPENNIRVISNFEKKFAKIFPSQGVPTISTNDGKFVSGVNNTGGKFCHRCSWRQITGTMSDCLKLRVNLKKSLSTYMINLQLIGVQAK